MRLKTLHITNAWHPKSGGIRTFYLALLEAANRERHEMHLVVPGPADGLERQGAYGTIHHVKAPLAPGSQSYRMIYPQQYLFLGGRVNRILREQQPDLVEFSDKYTLNYLGGLLRLGRLPGANLCPIVVGLSCERFTDSVRAYHGEGSLVGWLAKTYLRWLYFPMADHHISVSQYVADELAAVADGHKVDRGVWLGPMGVDYAAFAGACDVDALRTELLGRIAVPPESTLLVFAGRLAREKNIPLLFDTLQELVARDTTREYHLLLAGDGDYRDELETAARRGGPGRVHFLGHQSRAELARLLPACDAFVHSNPSEPFGIGPLEAMAAGLPLVAPDRGGVKHYANSENAWLAEPNPTGFADAILAVVSDRASRQARILAARRTAQNHDWARAGSYFLSLYRDILCTTRRQAGQPLSKPLFTSNRARLPARI